jgi:hypothetical protein
MKNGIFRVDSIHTLDSRTSTTDTLMTKINYNGNLVPLQLSSHKLLQFLIMELKTKLKDYVPEGE